MQNDSDTYYIAIRGKANIPEPLTIDHNYKVICDCSITENKKKSNEDGTYSITYLAEPLTAEITANNGKIIKAKDPRRNSQKIRNMLFKHYHEEGVIYDFDRCYDQATWVIISMMPHILREAVKRIENESIIGN